MARNVTSVDAEFSCGSCARGLEVGKLAGQNLADNFPGVDHAEGDSLISVKSTTRIATRQQLLQTIGDAAAQARNLPDILEGFDANGLRRTLPTRDYPRRGLVMFFPLEPVNWDPRPLASELRQISRLYRVTIRAVPVRGLRGR